MFSVVKPRAKMQETLTLNQEVSVVNRLQEMLVLYDFTYSDERKLQSLYEKCQQNGLTLSAIFMNYLEEIAPEGKNPYTAQQVEHYLRFFFVSEKDEYFVKVLRQVFMSFWDNRFEAEKVMIIIEQFANFIMKIVMEELYLSPLEAFDYVKSISSCKCLVKQLLIEVMTEQMLEEVVEEMSSMINQKGSIWHPEEMIEGVHNSLLSTIV
ncbi:hypothetical protein [Lysinibacillus odysseyi]|uniref:Uncharacterized protein n=1 Tax=Lysinibacillus odysseyi 34hs-1 = NBRC 100172 TaxID=1220589 RepID=A0A0A3IKZ9_9BACI|nr:hypothetical protein [Lysinibacillus odysseyi]KGR85441.1 hypothetical protein CD32_09495 [Lysinibacillus odysseyi 34hs-1 = NBRC 100172]